MKAPLDRAFVNVRLGGGKKKSKEKRSSVCDFLFTLSLLASSNKLCVIAISLSADSAVGSANRAYN